MSAGSLTKPGDERVASRQGLPKAVVGGLLEPVVGDFIALWRLYHQSRNPVELRTAAGSSRLRIQQTRPASVTAMMQQRLGFAGVAGAPALEPFRGLPPRHGDGPTSTKP